MNVTDKKIRQMYRKECDKVAREQKYIEKNNQIKFLIGIIIFESIGIIIAGVIYVLQI